MTWANMSQVMQKAAPGIRKAMRSVQPQQRPSWLGQLGQLVQSYASNRDNWRIAGATLRDMSTGGNSVEEVAASIQDRQRQEMQDAWQRQLQGQQIRTWKREDAEETNAAAERAARVAALESVPEELRPFAALGIEGPITQYYRNRYPTPSRAPGAMSGAPDLPRGFQWVD